MKTKDWKFKKKECIICKDKFKPTNGKQITCNQKCKEKLHIIISTKYNKKYPEKVAKSSREYFQRNKKKISKRTIEYLKKHKDIVNVRSKTSYWIRKFNLRKGFCNKCGIKTILQSHHFSYNPNIFILICESCLYKYHHKEKRK